MESVTYPTGVKKELTWGSRGELEKIEYKRSNGTSLIRRLTYTYDANLQIKQVDTELGMRARYTYDDRGRLTRADYAGGDFEAWVLDSNGNITKYSTQAGSETRSYDAADQVVTITRGLPAGGTEAIQHVHDPRGNLRRVVSASEVRDLAWDAQGWLKSVTVGGAEKLRASYLDDYKLRSLQTPAGSTLFSWNLGNVLSEFETTGAEKGFLVGVHQLDSTLERGPPQLGARETLVTDHLESVLGTFDDSAIATGDTEYRSYGEIRRGTDPGALAFAGARRNAGTGYLYLRNRWIDPKTGRFLSRDPIGFAGGWNQYAYVRGNPISGRDPIGLMGPPIDPRTPQDQVEVGRAIRNVGGAGLLIVGGAAVGPGQPHAVRALERGGQVRGGHGRGHPARR
jgi:RHS repeat-associated protein